MAAPVKFRTPRPLRRLLFGVGSLLTALMILWGSAQALDRLSIQEERVARSYAGVASIDLRHSHGNVELVRAAGRRVTVVIESRHGFLNSRGPTDELADGALRGGELRLRGGCDFVTVGTCEEDYRVAVPRGVAVVVRSSAGETVARGLRGDVDLRASAGEVRAFDIRGETVSLSSRAGAVTANAVRATRLTLDSRAGGIDVSRSVGRRVVARAAAGEVALELLRAPLRVDADSRAGEVRVVVPDVGYAVDARTSAGDEDIQIRQVRTSRRTIDIETHAGSVRVLPLPRSAAPARSPERDRARAWRARSRR